MSEADFGGALLLALVVIFIMYKVIKVSLKVIWKLIAAVVFLLIILSMLAKSS